MFDIRISANYFYVTWDYVIDANIYFGVYHRCYRSPPISVAYTWPIPYVTMKVINLLDYFPRNVNQKYNIKT